MREPFGAWGSGGARLPRVPWFRIRVGCPTRPRKAIVRNVHDRTEPPAVEPDTASSVPIRCGSACSRETGIEPAGRTKGCMVDEHEAHTPAQSGTEASADAHAMHHGHAPSLQKPDPHGALPTGRPTAQLTPRRRLRTQGPRRPHRPRDDVPPEVLGLPESLAPGDPLQLDDPGVVRVPASRLPRQRLDHALVLRDRLRLRRRAVPADGPPRAAQSQARDDDVDLPGHQRRLRLQLRRPGDPCGRGVLLGTGDADRHHAPRPLAGDAQRSTGLRRAARTGAGSCPIPPSESRTRGRWTWCRHTPCGPAISSWFVRGRASRPMEKWCRANPTSAKR